MITLILRMYWIFLLAGVTGWLDFMPVPKTELYVGVDPRKENHPIYRTTGK